MYVYLDSRAIDCVYTDIRRASNSEDLLLKLWNDYCMTYGGNESDRIVYRDEFDELCEDLGISCLEVIDAAEGGECRGYHDYFTFRRRCTELYSHNCVEDCIDDDDFAEAFRAIIDQESDNIREAAEAYGFSLESLRADFVAEFEGDYKMNKVNKIDLIRFLTDNWDDLAYEELDPIEDEEDEDEPEDETERIVYKGNIIIHTGNVYTATYIIDDDVYSTDCKSLDAAKKYLDRLMAEGEIAQN